MTCIKSVRWASRYGFWKRYEPLSTVVGTYTLVNSYMVY